MSEAPNVTPIRAAFDKAKVQKKRDKPPEKRGGGGGGEIVSSPPRLPEYAPVKALGEGPEHCFFLDHRGQYVVKPAEKLGRLAIIKLFGGEEFLIANWPTIDKQGKPKHEFDHGRIGPVLISSCADAGLFDPLERVRGPGAWREEDGTLVMHCGAFLYTATKNALSRQPAGLRARMLYEAKTAMPEPVMGGKSGVEGPGAKLLDMLDSFTFARGTTDAKLALGWIGAAMLAGAPAWRPMIWITGGRGTGKSTFQNLLRAVLGEGGYIRSEDATRAYVFQRIGRSTLPVLLDEFENQRDNRKREEILALAIAASSGGVVGRGGADGVPTSFVARNTFAFSSIVVPALDAAARSRIAMLKLEKRKPGSAVSAPEGGEKEEDPETDDATDEVLGARAQWELVGRELRGRLLSNWHRYDFTVKAYKRALRQVGHEDRAAEQFGAIGAAYDLLMYDYVGSSRDDFVSGTSLHKNAQAWAAMLPPSTLAETASALPEEQSCLRHLLTAQPEFFRGNKSKSIAEWLHEARKEREEAGKSKVLETDASDILKRAGIALYRDKHDDQQWWIAIATEHREIAKIYSETRWSGQAGSAGAWSQMFERIEYERPGDMTIKAKETRKRFVKQRFYCWAVPWEAAFEPVDGSAGDADARDME